MNFLLKKYEWCVRRVIRRRYSRLTPEKKEELLQVGMIGLWETINLFLNKVDHCSNNSSTDFVQTLFFFNSPEFDEDEFIKIACAKIRFAMCQFLRNDNIVKITDYLWNNYRQALKVSKILKEYSIEAENEIPFQERFEKAAKEKGIATSLSLYKALWNLLQGSSLDEPLDDSGNANKYDILPYKENETKRIVSLEYASYIIESAFAGIKSERDKSIVKTWIYNIYYGKTPTISDLAALYGLSEATTGTIINDFIEICRFVRKCENACCENSEGQIMFPAYKQMPEKVRGVSWDGRRSKWRVKYKGSVIGHYDTHEEAVKVRSNAVKNRNKVY